MKSGLATELELANQQIQYDEHVKNVLSNRYILAWILKCVVEEFEAFLPELIAENYIQPNIEVAQVPVLPGQTNTKDKILGDNTEDKVPNEGFITYDIRFHAILPTQPAHQIKLLVNVEAQKTFSPGYPIISRGIFYGARMISAQLDTEFSIPMHQEHLSKEVHQMCNLSEWVLEQGIDNGIELTKKVLNLSLQGLSAQDISASLQISLERVIKILE